MNLLYAKRALGLLSIGLGVVAVAEPRRVANFLGLTYDDEAMSAFGAREIASGAGLLSPVKPGPWFWVRVGGDAMDLVGLARAIGQDRRRRAYAVAAFAAVAAIAVVDVMLAAEATRDKRAEAQAAA